MAALAARLGTSLDDPWRRFPEHSPEWTLCNSTAAALRREAVPMQPHSSA